MSAIAFRYLPEANADGGFIAGVPLRDLSEEEVAAMPRHLRAAVHAAPYFDKAPSPAPKGAQKAKE